MVALDRLGRRQPRFAPASGRAADRIRWFDYPLSVVAFEWRGGAWCAALLGRRLPPVYLTSFD